MLISLLFSSPIAFLIIASGLVAAITIHEFAHAWVADRLGDPTPRINDRVSLDPRAHLDPLGTLAILFVGFGWGKPVTFDPYNLKDPVRDTALIALAGPASNLILAAGLAALVHLSGLSGFLSLVLAAVIQINVMLAIFNLVPIFPLDGSKILQAVLPAETAFEYEAFMQRYGMILLLFLIAPFNGQSMISQLIFPIIDAVTSALGF